MLSEIRKKYIFPRIFFNEFIKILKYWNNFFKDLIENLQKIHSIFLKISSKIFKKFMQIFSIFKTFKDF